MPIKQDLLNRLNQLTSEKNYKAVAKLLYDSSEEAGRSTDMKDRSFSDTLTAYCKQIIGPDVEGAVPPEKIEIIENIYKEFATMRTEGVIETGKQYKAWLEKINNGEVAPINELLIDTEKENESLKKKAAADIAIGVTDEGKKLYVAYNTLGSLCSGFISQVPKNSAWAAELDRLDKIYGNMCPMNNEFVKSIYDKHPEVSPEDKAFFHKKFSLNPMSGEDIHIDPTSDYKHGEIKIASVTKPFVRNFFNINSPVAIDKVKKQHEIEFANAKAFKEESDKLTKTAIAWREHLRDNGNAGLKDNQAYKKFTKQLINLKRLGSDKYEIQRGGRTIKTDTYQPPYILINLRNTIEAGKEYVAFAEKNLKKNDIGSYNEAYNEYMDYVYDTIDALEEHLPKLEDYDEKIPPSDVNKTIRKDQRVLDGINSMITNRGYTKMQMAQTRVVTLLSEDMTALNKHIADAKIANNVFTKHDDYDDAIDAMRSLQAVAVFYKEAREKNGISENDRQAVDQMQEKAKEAEEKISKYIERKEKELKKKGKLDSKGTSRLNIMRSSLKTCKSISAGMEETQALLDSEWFDREKREQADKLKQTVEFNKNTMQSQAADMNDGNIKIIDQGAANAMDTIVSIYNTPGEITNEQKQQGYEALAKFGVYKSRELHENTNMTQEEYDAYIKNMTSDKNFIKSCGEMTKEALLFTAAGSDVIENIMADYMNLKAKDDLEKQAEEYNLQNCIKTNCKKLSDQLENIINNSDDPHKDEFKNDNSIAASTNLQAAHTAIRALETLQIIANEPGELDPEDVQMVRDSMAALAVQTNKAIIGKKGPITNDDYVKSVQDIAASQSFIKAAGNIDKASVRSFLADEKSPAKLMDKMLMSKKNLKSQEAPDGAVKNKALEKTEDGIRRSGTLKTNTNPFTM
ncbi:MAG: hypothetical protein IKR76_10795 [Ruminococcus sp.]|nr:hypothetical protein [Ruminococcus sp.]